ncbi:MAG: hypothetical protein J6A96_02135 [Clostridia bacterium]|nr:hypothetical protein [Clostridia bacterium]
MKIALTVMKWVGFGLSIMAIFGVFPMGLPLIPVCGLGLFVWIYGTIVNAISIKKHLKQQYSIKTGVLQIISIAGLVPGVIMIVATCLNKKQLEKEYEEAEKFFESAIDEIEPVSDEVQQVVEAVAEDVEKTVDSL